MGPPRSRLWAGAALGAAAVAKVQLGRQGSRTTSSSATGLPSEVNAAWLTQALREGGLLSQAQHVVQVEVTTLSGEPGDLGGGGISGSTLLRARMEYGGAGDLGSLPKTAILKFTDLDAVAKLYKISWNRGVTLLTVAVGVHPMHTCQAEHTTFRYLSSGPVLGQPWALPAPRLYFEHLEVPVEQPSQAAIVLGGAWTGTARPGVRSLLVLEDLSERGLAHFDQFSTADAVGAGRFSEEAGIATVRAVARWHAAHWGRYGTMGPLVRPASLLSAHGRHFTVMGVIKVGWAIRLKLFLRQAASTSCPLVRAALSKQADASSVRKDPSGGLFGSTAPSDPAFARAQAGDPEQMRAVLGAALSRTGVVAALQGVERAYGPVLAYRLRDRLHSGAAALRNRTLLHGDLHISNIMYIQPDDGGPIDVRLLDFAQAGWGHAAYELLYFLRFYSEERLLEGAAGRVLEEYHAALAPCSYGFSYSACDLWEDWALAVVDWATLFLVDASEAAEKVLGSEWQVRQTTRLLLMLEMVAESDTAVGSVLRQAARASDLDGVLGMRLASAPHRSRL